MIDEAIERALSELSEDKVKLLRAFDIKRIVTCVINETKTDVKTAVSITINTLLYMLMFNDNLDQQHVRVVVKCIEALI